MIGQAPLLKRIDKLIANNKLPRFLIIEGKSNTGRVQLVSYIAKKLGQLVEIDKSVESIRHMIKTSYAVLSPIIYHVVESEKMHPQAMNSLLLVTEEPPLQAYFILTVDNVDRIIPTIKSRATILAMLPYSKAEIVEYVKTSSKTYTATELEIVTKICYNLDDVDYVATIDVTAFWEFVTSTMDNIFTMSGIESFKIGSNLKFKDVGYEPQFFMKCLQAYCYDKLMADESGNVRHYAESVFCISKYKSELEIKSLNRVATFDMFIMDLRAIWRS